jgi:putative ATP-dependent endonuclease of OLD family
MHIRQIEIKNFRLLEQADLFLEERTTVIVGRNNSGKTSLTELFRRLLADKPPSFRLEDFSLSVHDLFWNAFVLQKEGAEEPKVREALPFIEVKLNIRYEKDSPSLGPLGDFVIDLNPDCVDATLRVRYQAKESHIGNLFADIVVNENVDQDAQKKEFCRAIRDRVPTQYEAQVVAVDPNDPTNQKLVEWSNVRGLLQGGFINAQRGLDDVTHRDRAVLGKILEDLLKTATSETADPADKDIARKLEEAVEEIQGGIDDGFNKQLQNLLPAFSLFGYPGFSDPGLRTETTLDVKRLLTDHTTIHYAGINGINLPEAYNGLGARNLIFILLKLMEFFKSFMAMPAMPGIHLVFIEEPEVHLHPQMQEVFINKLGEIAELFAKKFGSTASWPVQFVVTTHSSHLANKAPFEAMRYFLATTNEKADGLRSTRIKDLRQGLSGTGNDDREFLHKYMTLTRCDLLFADKAVLIEGTTERLLLPKMIDKTDSALAADVRLASQYVSVVEVGGAYAHLFFDLLSFLELRTLIITDLDAANAADDGKSSKVSDATHTTNACIKKWFEGTSVEASALVGKTENEKTKGICRLAYQVPETVNAPCGRSFEQAFVLANPALFAMTECPVDEREQRSWTEAERVKKKSDFALRFAINDTDWNVPRYISEGLLWLAEGGRAGGIAPAQALQEMPVAVVEAAS